MATINELETEVSRIAQLVQEESATAERDTLVITTPIRMLLPVTDFTEQLARPQTYFIADRAYRITSIREAHDIAQTSADGCSLMVSKVTGTTAPNAAVLHLITDVAFNGADNVYSGFNLKGIDANTVTNGTLTNQASSLTLAAGNRLVWGVNGTISSVFVSLTTVLRKV